MKIEDIRRNQEYLKDKERELNDDAHLETIQGNNRYAFKVEEKGIKLFLFGDFLLDDSCRELRDWLCELYGLPEKEDV